MSVIPMHYVSSTAKNTFHQLAIFFSSHSKEHESYRVGDTDTKIVQTVGVKTFTFTFYMSEVPSLNWRVRLFVFILNTPSLKSYLQGQASPLSLSHCELSGTSLFLLILNI